MAIKRGNGKWNANIEWRIPGRFSIGYYTQSADWAWYREPGIIWLGRVRIAYKGTGVY